MRIFFFTCTSPDGARGWKAPELITPLEENQRRQYDFSVDIFPLGYIFGYTLSNGGKHPFGDNPTNQDYHIYWKKPMLLKANQLKKPYCNDEVAISLIQLMVNMEPSERATATQVLAHRFFEDLSHLNTCNGNGSNQQLSSLFI